jgi:RNA polymerase sigma factor (TIGR02999 family)
MRCLPADFPAGILGPMNEVSRFLSAIEHGDPSAAAKLLPLVYDELRKLAAGHVANEGPGHTLDATALVHEAYLRLVGDQQFDGRGHFFAAAAEAMRRILVEHARARGRLKRGGERVRVELLDRACALAEDPDLLLSLDELLIRLDACASDEHQPSGGAPGWSGQLPPRAPAPRLRRSTGRST